jgi:23S rRNA (guanine745-N1)-methyltransferase
MKEVLYEVPYKNEVRRDTLEHFSLTDVRRVTDRITITEPAHIQALFAMTPYYWKTSPADRDRLYAQDKLETEIAFDLLLYKKEAIL